MRLEEIFHSYDDPDDRLDFKARKPLKKGDTIRVFHGFRDMTDAIRTARQGLSGKVRASRNYSYESDNNPHGLFVTTSIDVAKRFSNYCIMEFVTTYDEIEAPVWPGGGYTVQGQMSQSWPGGREGIIARRKTQKNLANEPLSHNVPEIHGSDDNYLARTLLTSGERQALFVGDLNPNRIVAFYLSPVPYHYKAPWTKLDRAEFLTHTAGEKLKYSHDNGDGRVFQPDDVFDGPTFLRLLITNSRTADEVQSAMEYMANEIFSAPVNRRRQKFTYYLAPYLWPKQYADAFKWLYRTYFKVSNP